MGSYEVQEQEAVDGYLRELLEARNAGAALQALRQLFVGEQEA